MKTSGSLALLLATAVVASLGAAESIKDEVGPVPEPRRRQFTLAPFYQQHLDVGGWPVVGLTNVSRFALREAAWIVRQMLATRPDILSAMASNRVRLAVMAWNEFTTDVSEHARSLAVSLPQMRHWNDR